MHEHFALLSLHIVPGHVEWNGKMYSKVRDGSIGEPMFLMPPMILPVPEAKFKAQMQLVDSMKARAVITESSDCLRMSYEISTAAGAFFLGPRQLSHNIATAVSGNSCSGKRCRPFDDLYENFLFTLYSLRLPCEGPRNRKNSFDIPEKPNIVLFGDHQLARCTAVTGSHDTRVILQERECIACCARRALMADKPHQVVIISRLTVEGVEKLLERRDPLLCEA